MLQITDYLWVQHLTAIEDVRQGIGLRAYGQQDPLVAFKREGFQMFEQLMATMQSDMIRRVFRAQVQQTMPAETVLSRHRAETDGDAVNPSNHQIDHQAGQAPPVARRERRRQERAAQKLARRKNRSGKTVRSS